MSASTLLATAPIGLDELASIASLQTRKDRKYIAGPDVLDELLVAMPSTTRVLEIDGRRRFGYESVYFDTPELDLFTATARRRRNRSKVRTRIYTDSGLCRLEVKTKARGRTVKVGLDHAARDRHRLDGRSAAFVAEALDQRVPVAALAPVLTTSYSRTTLVEPAEGIRLTVDDGLRCRRSAGLVDDGTVASTIGDAVIIETKSPGPPGWFDRWLWRQGVRPVKVSKFGTGLAALDPALPSNRWHRVIGRHWQIAS